MRRTTFAGVRLPGVTDCDLGARLRHGMIAEKVPERGFIYRGPLPNTAQGPGANSCGLLRTGK